MVPEAWAPLGGGRYHPFADEMLLGIAAAHEVLLRWNIQRGVVVIPKSVHSERIEENFLIKKPPMRAPDAALAVSL